MVAPVTAMLLSTASSRRKMVAPSAPANTICQAYLRGKCHRGKQCRFIHDRNAKAAGRKPQNSKEKGKTFKGDTRFDDSDDDEEHGPGVGMHVPGAETVGLLPVKDRLAAAKKTSGQCGPIPGFFLMRLTWVGAT